MIDKQKNELDQFIEKFSDLEKFIKEYKEEEIQIGRLKETILGKKNRLEEIERRIRELEGRLRTFKIDIDNLRNDNSKFLILIDEWTK
jgi:transcription elongation GreA/GreB family factor